MNEYMNMNTLWTNSSVTR